MPTTQQVAKSNLIIYHVSQLYQSISDFLRWRFFLHHCGGAVRADVGACPAAAGAGGVGEPRGKFAER